MSKRKELNKKRLELFGERVFFSKIVIRGYSEKTNNYKALMVVKSLDRFVTGVIVGGKYLKEMKVDETKPYLRYAPLSNVKFSRSVFVYEVKTGFFNKITHVLPQDVTVYPPSKLFALPSLAENPLWDYTKKEEIESVLPNEWAADMEIINRL